MDHPVLLFDKNALTFYSVLNTRVVLGIIVNVSS